MSTAGDIEIWHQAVQVYENGSMAEAIKIFSSMATISSKISFNIGCAHLWSEDVETALKSFQEAVDKDGHLAIAYFMIGISFYKTERYLDALEQFERTMRCMRNNKMVDYKQIGLKHQLYACEVLMNKAVIHSKLGETEKAKALLLEGVQEKVEKWHERIIEALHMLQIGCELELSSPPNSAIFKPPAHAVKNLKKKDYLGKAKVLYTADPTDKNPGFSGLKFMQESRESLLSDIRTEVHRQTLRKVSTSSKPILSSMQLGKVLERAPPCKPLPQTPDEEQQLCSETWSGKPMKPLPNCPLPQTPLRPRNSPAFQGQKNRPIWAGKPSENSAFEEGCSTKSEETGVPSCAKQRPKKPLPLSPATKEGETPIIYNSDTASNKIDVEIEFNFSVKIKIHEKTSLNELMDMIYQHPVPSNLSVCYEDGLGRQKRLTKVALDHILQGSIDDPKLVCSSSNKFQS